MTTMTTLYIENPRLHCVCLTHQSPFVAFNPAAVTGGYYNEAGVGKEGEE